MITTERQLTKILNTFTEGMFPLEIIPQYSYTNEQVCQATYVIINPDDINYQLGFDPKELIPMECYDLFHIGNIDNLDIFIY